MSYEIIAYNFLVYHDLHFFFRSLLFDLKKSVDRPIGT